MKRVPMKRDLNAAIMRFLLTSNIRDRFRSLIQKKFAIYLREVCGKIFEVTGIRVTSTVCKVEADQSCTSKIT